MPGAGDDRGAARTWHCLDTAAVLEEQGASPVGTILAVHGVTSSHLAWQLLAEELPDCVVSDVTAARVLGLHLPWEVARDDARSARRRTPRRLASRA